MIKVYSIRVSVFSTNCYLVQNTETKEGFLIDPGDYEEKILGLLKEKEVKLTNFLSDKRFPAASFMLTKNNEAGFLHDGSTVCLQEFIAGDTYGYGELPEMLMKPLAGTLGKLHSNLKDYSLPRDMDKSWMDDFNVENTVKKYDLIFI